MHKKLFHSNRSVPTHNGLDSSPSVTNNKMPNLSAYSLIIGGILPAEVPSSQMTLATINLM